MTPRAPRCLPWLLACALAACKASAMPVPVAHRVASTAPSAAATASATPGPVPALLSRPGADALVLRGTLQLDAGRALAGGGASLVERQGAGLTSKVKLTADDVAALVAKLHALPDDGTSLTSKVKLVADAGVALALGDVAIAPDGTSLIDPSGALVVSAKGGNIVSNNGGGVLSNNGGSIVANNGGSLISDAGGNLLSDAGGNYQLAWVAGAPQYGLQADAPLPLGLMLPAAGMRVGVESLATQRLLPIGQGADGKPVYTVYSSLAGTYELYLPAAEAHTVQLVALPPGAKTTRLALELLDLPTSDPGAHVVGEASANAARFIRETFAQALGSAAAGGANPDSQFGATAAPLLAEFAARAAILPADQRAAAFQRATDTLLSQQDLFSLDTSISEHWAGIVPKAPPLPSFATLIQLFWHAYQLGALGLQQDGVDGFNAKLLDALQHQPDGKGQTPAPRTFRGYDLVATKVTSPDDLLRFLATNYLTPPPGLTVVSVQVPFRFLLGYTPLDASGKPTLFAGDNDHFELLDRTSKDVVKGFDYANFQMEELRACTDGILLPVLAKLVFDPASKAAVLNAIAPAP